jgi:hypothetical protein
MTYENSITGRLADEASDAGKRLFWSFDDVEERMVEAMDLWRRSPDRERGWLHVKAFWPEIRRSGVFQVVGNEIDHPEEKPELRPLPLTRAQVRDMMETSEWMAHIPERDRRLVAIVLAYKVQGKKPQWLKIKKRLGIPFGAHGLRKRYSRAITSICSALNSAEKREDCVSR